MRSLLNITLMGLLLLSFCVPASAKKIDGQKYKKVIVVAPQGGDFTDVTAAYESIGETSEKNNVLIFIKPGIYFMDSSYTSLLMTKNYVDIQGSGPDLTILKSNTANMSSSSYYMIMNGAISEIRDLSLELTSNNSPFNEYYVVALQLGGGQQQALRNVRISLNDTMNARQVVGGIDIRGGIVQLDNVSIYVNSATYNWYYGLFSDGNVSANNLNVVSNGTYGIFAGYNGANLTLANSKIIANNGTGLASYGGAIKSTDSYIVGGASSLSFIGSGIVASFIRSTLFGTIWEGAPGTNAITITDCVDGTGSPIIYP